MGERGQTMARAVVIGGPEQHWWRVLAQFVSVGLDHGIMWDPLIVPLDRPRANETSAASFEQPIQCPLQCSRFPIHGIAPSFGIPFSTPTHSSRFTKESGIGLSPIRPPARTCKS